MFVGPVFSREATTAPRRVQFYAVPAVAVAALLCLLWTYLEILTGSLSATTAGLSARFGSEAFRLLAPLVLAVATLFSALLTAAAVAQEKDRKTLVLLLLTRLTNAELVIGRLLASLLVVLMVIAASAPFFFLTVLLGGVSYSQVARVLAVTVMSALAAGSLGSTIALWREKTFQALAMTTLVLVLWLLAWEAVGSGVFGNQLWSNEARGMAIAMSPWQAVLSAAESDLSTTAAAISFANQQWPPVVVFFAAALVGIVALNGLAIARVRVWNPTREMRASTRDEVLVNDAVGDLESSASRADIHRAPGRRREVWDNPVLWREIRTWAYGKKILVVRLAYAVVVVITALALYSVLHDELTLAGQWNSRIPPAAKSLAPLLAVSIVLVNALAVTSLTSERDARALDLLLVTDLTPKEFVFGKLGGVLYNSKEMILLPLLLAGYVWWIGFASMENLVFLAVGFLVMQFFAAVLGLHCGMTYVNSRQATAVSIGTLLFLFVGVSVCTRMMVALGDRFENQLTAFLGFIVGGGFALYAALGWRLESRAMFWACIAAPFATFFVITSFLQQQYGSVLLVTVVAYGMSTAAMLVPAVAEFDVATGRTGERLD
ncbi:MAG: ABC transporter permease subunit [Aeoliella sp.]